MQDGSSDGYPLRVAEGVTLTFKVKEGWTAAQKAEAAEKAASLDKLAREGKLTVTKDISRSSKSASSRFKAAGGEVEKGQDVDHVHDLQLGGKDSVENMSPLDSSVNRSFGAQAQQQQLKNLPDGTKVCRVKFLSEL